MPNNLPNPIPAGSVVFVKDGEPRLPKKGAWWKSREFWVVATTDYSSNNPLTQCYTRHTLPTPLHHITPEMVSAVKNFVKLLKLDIVDWAPEIQALESAFAPILEAPSGSAQGGQEEKVKTEEPLAEKIRRMAINGADRHGLSQTLARAIDSLRAEVRALKQSQMRSMP